MSAKAIAITCVAIIIGLAAFVRYRTGKESVTPGSVIPPTLEAMQTREAQSTPSPVVPTAPAAVTTMTLSVTSPTNNSTVTNSSVAVRGKTAPRADVFVNEAEGKADDNGNFSVSVQLDEGENYFVIVANDEFGNAIEAELTVTYEP